MGSNRPLRFRHRSQDCDVLLITVTDAETRAVLNRARDISRRKESYRLGKEKAFYDLGMVGSARTMVVRSETGSDTVGGSLITTRTAIDELRPRVVIMVGIAFGLDPKRQSIGTVLVSTALQQYDLQRVGTNPKTGRSHIILRGERVSASGVLVDRLRSIAWRHKVQDPQFGLVLSGQKLVDNIDYRDELGKMVPDAIGGEMEGAGFSVAARRMDWIVVKAVADWADGQKRKKKLERQRKAAAAAATFVLEAVKSGWIGTGLSDVAPIEGGTGGGGIRQRSRQDRVARFSARRAANWDGQPETLKDGLELTGSLPDLLTPGATDKEFMRKYVSAVGRSGASRLLRIRRKAIRAVAVGDFKGQVVLGQLLQEIGKDHPYVVGIGLYFAGEGFRLLADTVEQPTDKEALLEKARRSYSEAREYLPEDPRPVRGLARLSEIQADLRTAREQFETAEALATLAARGMPADQRHAMDHERLRTTRHLLHCMIDLRRATPRGPLHSSEKTHELEGLVVKCENLHTELLPQYTKSEKWHNIEAFMGYVFIAEGWGAVGNGARCRKALLEALTYRRKSLRRGRPFSPVERNNLLWAVGVGLDAGAVSRAFRQQLEHLHKELLMASDGGAWEALDSILRVQRRKKG